MSRREEGFWQQDDQVLTSVVHFQPGSKAGAQFLELKHGPLLDAVTRRETRGFGLEL